MSEPGSLAALLGRAAAGVFPPPDASITFLPPAATRDCGVFAFTAHHVIVADADPAWVMERLPEGDLSAPLSPPFLADLGRLTGRRVNTVDMLCACAALPGPPALRLAPAQASAHPRVARARRYRDHVRAWETDGGLVVLGRGVAGRWEVSVEVDPGRRGTGLGRRLASAARHLMDPGEPLWAQIAPGNAASVRAFAAAGFTPVGAEALLVAAPPS